MQLVGIHAAALNLCCVCVDSAEAGECRGQLFHYYTNEALPFQNQDELIMMMDALCDELGYPEAAEQLRSFGRSARAKAPEKEVTRLMSKDDLAAQKGMMATFVVHVMHRQNATWQGTVVWAEKNQKASFRSALELVKLMDSAVRGTLPGSDALHPPVDKDENDSSVQE